MTCNYCKKSLVSETAYEDGIYNIIIKWLCDVTCTKWYRLPIDNERPQGIEDAQYGTIWLDMHEQSTASYEANDTVCKNASGDDVICTSIVKSKKVDVVLSVFRSSGDTVELIQPNDPLNYNRGCVDVLESVNDMIFLDRNTEELKSNDIQLHQTSKIVPDSRHIKGSFELFSVASFVADVCYTTSYESSKDGRVVCVELCDGSPICIQKTYNCQH